MPSISKSGNDVTFTWGDFTDDSTPTDGLSYNIKVVDTADSHEAAPGMALSDGTRLIPARGPMQPGASTNQWTLTLPDGNYSWAVQAIDTSFAGSEWADGGAFTVP